MRERDRGLGRGCDDCVGFSDWVVEENLYGEGDLERVGKLDEVRELFPAGER